MTSWMKRLLAIALITFVMLGMGFAVKADAAGPLAGVVFRVGFDPRSNMKYSSIRIFSGTIKSDTNLIRNDEKKGIRPGHILKSQGGENEPVDAGIAGDIVTLAKVEELKISDLVHDGKVSGKIELQAVPEPMFSLALKCWRKDWMCCWRSLSRWNRPRDHLPQMRKQRNVPWRCRQSLLTSTTQEPIRS